jgi:DNA-binding GntR family transcriptional regulator
MEVYEWLRSQIIYGTLPAGTSLTLEAIASETRVSLTPVREALASLEPTGLIVREARKGYRVAPALGADELVQVLDVREALEVRAATRAAERMTEEAIALLAETVEQQERAYSAHIARAGHDGGEALEALKEYLVLDARFHDLLFEGAANPFLDRVAGSLSGVWHRARDTMAHGLRDGRTAIDEHRAIHAAIARRDAQAAASAMSAHIERIGRSVVVEELDTAG